jgi:bifunctional DNA-binding transcriptional regulator/antitoxin component of YhaV-PrlF toxin-antitoxin module
MARIRISPKGQLLILKRIREKYSIKPGKTALIIESPEGILIKSAHEDPIEAACGFLGGAFSLTDELIKEHFSHQ